MRRTLLGTTSLIIALTGVAVAQDSPVQAEDTVVVTATKREQTLQEIPVSVQVVDDEVIERAEINDIIDLQSIVPSLQVTQNQTAGNATFIIRGFGNGANNTGTEPSVGVYVDGVYRGRTAASVSDFPDLERVEVLRGPQSTLFGKNASAGVISFVTKKPSYEFGGNLDVTVGNYGAKIVRGYVTGPLSDTVAFSLSGSVNKRDGYVENVAGGDDINDRDRWLVKGQLLWEPTDRASLRLSADYDQIDELCCYTPYVNTGDATGALALLGGFVQDDPFEYRAGVDIPPRNRIYNTGVSLHGEFDLGFADLVTITAYRNLEQFQDFDADFTSLNALNSQVLDNSIDTFTQEVRLVGSTERFDWLIGGFYFDEEVDNQGNVLFGDDFRAFADVLSGGAIGALEGVLGFDEGTFFRPGAGSQEFFTQENTNYSIFGQADVFITDRLTFTGGVAFTSDTKDVTGRTINDEVYFGLPLDQSPFSDAVGAVVFGGAFQDATGLEPTPANINAFAMMQPTLFAQIQAGAAAATPAAIAELQGFQFLPPFVAFPNSVEDGSSDDEEVTYTARLSYDVMSNLNIYASYATGFKASSWNLGRDSSFFAADEAALGAAGLLVPNRAAGTRFAGPEETTVYEIGLKYEGSRGAVNIALFDQTIEGFQSTLFQGTGFVLANAGEQSTLGAEIEANVEVFEGLTLAFAGTFLDPEYDSFVNAPSVDENGNAIVADLSGETPAGIHDVTLSVAATYEHDFGNGKTGFVRTDYQFANEVQAIDNVPEQFLSREVNAVNASIGMSWPNDFDATLWVRNATNDERFQTGFPTTAQPGSFSGYPNIPRTWGVTLSKGF